MDWCGFGLIRFGARIIGCNRIFEIRGQHLLCDAAPWLATTGEITRFIAHDEARLLFEAGEIRAQALGIVVHLDVDHFFGPGDGREMGLLLLH